MERRTFTITTIKEVEGKYGPQWVITSQELGPVTCYVNKGQWNGAWAVGQSVTAMFEQRPGKSWANLKCPPELKPTQYGGTGSGGSKNYGSGGSGSGSALKASQEAMARGLEIVFRNGNFLEMTEEQRKELRERAKSLALVIMTAEKALFPPPVQPVTPVQQPMTPPPPPEPLPANVPLPEDEGEISLDDIPF